MNWTTAVPAVTAAFLASLVEVVEAFTIILAASIMRGWRPALYGTGAALVVLALVVIVFGPLLYLVPVHLLQLAIGLLLLLFGMRWLRKAILRAAGLLPLHDEDRAFAREQSVLAEEARSRGNGLDWIAGTAAFKGVLIEGIEVVFIVIAVGAGQGLLLPASAGAAGAVVLVLLIGSIVHRPLRRVPENTLKFLVGGILSSFGVFWSGEGLGVDWIGADLAIVIFAGVFLGVGLGLAALLRRQAEVTT